MQYPSYHRKTCTRQFRYVPGPRYWRYLKKYLVVLRLVGLVVMGSRLYLYAAESRQTKKTNEAIAVLYYTGETQKTEESILINPAVTGVLLEMPVTSPAPTAFQQVSGKALPRFSSLLQENGDVIGWLTIKGMLDLPVVYRNNTYYLTRDVYKKRSAAGTLFLDENHPLLSSTQHLVLHGHNMKDGSMFGRLQRYLKLDFLQKHGFLQFDTLYQESSYVVIAVLIIPENVHSVGYINFLGHPSFRSTAQFTEFVNDLKERSVYVITIPMGGDDALLTLSTCYGDDRLLIVARRVRKGESISDLKQLLGYARKK